MVKLNLIVVVQFHNKDNISSDCSIYYKISRYDSKTNRSYCVMGMKFTTTKTHKECSELSSLGAMTFESFDNVFFYYENDQDTCKKVTWTICKLKSMFT